jgi:hypothetical protein
VVDENGPIPDRYAEATRLLARLHSRKLPAELPFGEDGTHQIPPYDLEAFLIEVDLLLDWYLPSCRERSRPAPSGPNSGISGATRWPNSPPGLRPGRCATSIRRT